MALHDAEEETTSQEPDGTIDAAPLAGVAPHVPRLTVVIPCLNEEKSIPGCVDQAREAIAGADLDGEVLVADNGSSDRSAELAAAHGARVIHVAGRGYGSAVRAGIEAASSPYIVLADGDGQHDFADIPRFVDKLDEGYELVMGNRFGEKIAPGAMSFTHRYIGNPLLSGLVRFLFHPGIHDAQCGMRALTRTAYLQMDLRTTGFELCPEMVVKAVRQKIRMTEIPIAVRPDLRERAPHLKTLPDGWRHLVFLLMCSPTLLFVAPGGALLALGLALVSWVFLGPQHIGHITLDTRAQLFGVLMSSIGFEIVSIGLFARVFSYSEPLRATKRSLARALRSVKLEEGLAFGALLIVIGLAGMIVEYVHWASHGYGVLTNDRSIIFWSQWFVLGVQIAFSSFFLSMLGISRGTWIGDH